MNDGSHAYTYDAENRVIQVVWARPRCTYRYFFGVPLYPFGFGLSFTNFAYTNAKVDHDQIAATDDVKVSVDVKNSGAKEGDEVVELYVTHPDVTGAPIRALAGFARVHLAAGEQRTVAIPCTIAKSALSTKRGSVTFHPAPSSCG